MRRPALLLSSILTIAIMVPTAEAAIIDTAAGGGPDHLPQLQANLNEPTHIARDGAGNLYIAVGAFSPCKVYKIDPAGTITHFAGNGEIATPAPFGDGGQARDASLTICGGLAVDATGNLYISDTGHGCAQGNCGIGRVRKVDAATGIITTVAGGGLDSPNKGDGGPAVNAVMRPS